LPKFGLTLKPWDNWSNPKGVPDWWTAYNKVKPHRHSDFHQGNLQNALNAVAGLFVMVLHLYEEKAKPAELIPSPQFFLPTDDHFAGANILGYGFGFQYQL